MAGEWSDDENAIVIRAYLEMLAKERRGHSYNKLEMNRRILGELPGRTRPGIEYKHANISAVLRDLGLDYVDGYKPRGNYQNSMVSLVQAALAGAGNIAATAKQTKGREVAMTAGESTAGDSRTEGDFGHLNPIPTETTAFHRLQKRAFGGGDVAARPGAEDDAWWPKGPPLAGIPELADAFVQAVRRQEGLTMVFLLGGAGNGKSFAARDLAERLGMVSQPGDGLAQRTYTMVIGQTHVEILNDATIASAKDYPGLQDVALATDILRWEAMLSKGPVAAFCCVNRGIIIDEIRELEIRGAQPSHLPNAVLKWLAAHTSGMVDSLNAAGAPELALAMPNPDVFSHFRQETVAWNGKRACVAALSVDASSLAQVDPALGESRAGNLFRQVVERCSVDASHRPEHCPIKANVMQWTSPTMLNNWVGLVESAEIASGRPHSYRELWGLAALTLTGPRFVEDGQPTDALSHVDHRLSAAKDADTDEERLAILLDLARFRSHEALFRAPYPDGSEFRVRFPPPTPAHQGLALVDPSVWGAGVSRVVEDAMQSLAVGEAPSRGLQSIDGFPEAWSPFDDLLERTIVAYVVDDDTPDANRRKLVSWWGGYLLRLCGVAAGQLGNAEVTANWRECDRASRRGPAALPMKLEDSIRALLYPQREGEPAGTMLIPAFAARVEPLRELRDGSPPVFAEQVNHSLIAFQVSRTGNRLMLDCMRHGKVISQMLLDFPLLREALACRVKQVGRTEGSVFIEPRIERSRAATLQGLPDNMRKLVAINGGERLEVNC